MALKPKQKALISALLANPMISNVKVAEKLGINNKTVGVWLKLPEFQEELERRMQQKWKDSERAAQQVMIDLMQEKDFKAAKYVLDSLGYAPQPDTIIGGSNEININVTGEIDD